MPRINKVAAVVVFACAIPVGLQAQQRVHTLDTLHVQAVSRVPQVGQAAFRSVDVITRDEIDLLPAQTIADVLGRVLNVDVLSRSAAQADVSIRGSTFEQVLVLVDGVRVSDEQTGHFDLDLTVPLAMVERIEILRGMGSTLYGSDAVGGVVNIVTRTRGHASAGLHAGSFGSGSASASVAVGPAFHAAADYARSDGHRAGTDYEMYQARAAFSQPASAGEFGVDVGFGVRDFGAADFYAPYNSHERTSTADVTVRYQSALQSRWQFAPLLSLRRHADRFTLKRDDPSFYQNEHESWQTGAELVARYRRSEAFALALGGEAFAAGLESAALGDRFERRVALYGEATLGKPASAAINAGLRTDWGNSFNGFVSPSLAASLRVSEHVRVRASASRGLRVPTWTDRYYTDPANVGDPNLRPERFWSAELGARLRVSDHVNGEVSVFHRSAEDLIDWARPENAPESQWRTMNVEHATFTGAEVSVSVPYVTLSGMTLSIDGSDAAGFVSKYALRQITEEVALSLELPVRPTSMAFTANLAHSRRRLEGAFFRADTRATWSHRQVRVNVDLLNLTNAHYLDASAKPVAGRSVSVGVTWSRQ